MLPVKEMLLTSHNRPHKKIIKPKGVVVHWTANEAAGANAIANRNYFNTSVRACSAHYIVDDKTIISCIPDNEVAYHVGADKYTKVGQSLREGIYSPNFFLIGIEMCVNSDGNFNLTRKNTIELISSLFTRNNFSINNLYRHYDITGKSCPKMLVPQDMWDKFRIDAQNQLIKDVYDLVFTSPYKLMDKSDVIKLFQTRLNKLGYSAGAEDGIFGYRTMVSVQHFQTKNKLRASGIIDLATFNFLLGGYQNV